MKRLTRFLDAILNLCIATVTTGKNHQAFIGAKWLVLFLRFTPRPLKRPLALRIVAMSPHHFYREGTPGYEGMSKAKWLEAEYKRNRIARAKICDQVLLSYVKPTDRVLDIGCGPGFLAVAVAQHVQTLYACDISLGVLECARVINYAPNINYIYSGESGFSQIADSSLDLAYSFAVIQHLMEPVIRSLFHTTAKKLRKGGRCLFQVQLESDKWKNEDAWTGDKSVAGRLKLKYALNSFSRPLSSFQEIAAEAGLAFERVRPMRELLDHHFDDIYYQDLIELSKP